MRRRRALALGALSLVAAGVAAVAVAAIGSNAHHAAEPFTVDLGVRAPALRDAIGLRVYLPADYRSGTRRYPVVYFLHGLPASSVSYRNTDFLRAALARAGGKAIVVAVQGARSGESDAEYLDSGPGHDWETAVARDVPRAVDARFRTVAGRSGRAIVGLSAGGYGAVLIGLHHLDRFSVIESWSGYFHPTDVTGTNALDLGTPDRNAHASAHSFVAGLRRAFAGNRTLLAFYVGASDTRFRAENELLDSELGEARVPHVFRVYRGGHTQQLWSRHAAAWLHLALSHLEPAH